MKRVYAAGGKRLNDLYSSDFACNYSSCAAPIRSSSIPRIRNRGNVSKPSKFVAFCNSQITTFGRDGDLKEAESIFNRMPFKNVVSWTALLTVYAENGDTVKARKLFDEMPQRNTAASNAMITAYIRNDLQISEAFELFCRMPERNPVSYAAMITGFVRAGTVYKAEKLYAEMPLIGRDPVSSNALISGYLKIGELKAADRVFKGMLERNVVSWSSMVDGYCKKGRITEARELFEKMPERNVVSWTVMIDGYLKMECFDNGFRLFLQMRRQGMKVNSVTLTVVLEACANLGRHEEGIQVHVLILALGFASDVFLGNSIINMYCRFGWMDEANRVFDLMDKKDTVSWNSLIWGHVQNGKVEVAYMLFKEMPERDCFSWTTIIAGLMSMGKTSESINLFKEMPEKDDAAWTAVVSGFVGNKKYKDAIIWFIQMLREAFKPNVLTCSSVVSALAGLAMLNLGLQIHACIVKMVMEFDMSIQNSLISMYAKCGNVRDAYLIFTNVNAPNLVTVNSMITGFAQHGFGEEALELFKKMQNEGYEPNEVTFLGILSACAHVGLVEEGWEYFKSMSSYHIKPRADHYACMVDLLGRAGLLNEAVDLIYSMPVKPHSGVWGALLNSSRSHMNLETANLAAQHLFDLDPNNATPLVVLSNMYAAVGQKMNEEDIRITTKSRTMKKIPGCSWIVV